MDVQLSQGGVMYYVFNSLPLYSLKNLSGKNEV